MGRIRRGVWGVVALGLCAVLVLLVVVGLSLREPSVTPADGAGSPHSEAAATFDLAAAISSDSVASSAASRDTDLQPTSDAPALALPFAFADPRREPDEPTFESLDDAPWAEVERRITAAVEFARAEKDVYVAPELVARLREQGEVHVIVRLAPGAHSIDALLADARHGAPYYLENLPVTDLDVGPQALENLLLSDRTGSVEVRRWASPSLEDTIPIVQADIATGDGADGTGFVVVVVDSGVDITHPFYADRLVDGHCFSKDALCANGGTVDTDSIGAGDHCDLAIAGCDHGTTVAGVAVGSGSARDGVAPAAGLISINVASRHPEDSNQVGYASDDVLGALDKVYSQRNDYAIAAVNLSFGDIDEPESRADCQVGNDLFTEVVALLRSAGIAVVVASGNLEFEKNLPWPACIEGVVSVGATTKADDVPAFSNTAPYLDLLAPGVEVTTSAPGGGFAAWSGTSYSAPHVAGAYAAIRSAFPDENVDRILLALQASGEPIENDKTGHVTPRIAVASALYLLETGDLRFDAEIFYDAVADGSSRCGLVGLELLAPLGLARWRRARRRRSIRS